MTISDAALNELAEGRLRSGLRCARPLKRAIQQNVENQRTGAGWCWKESSGRDVIPVDRDGKVHAPARRAPKSQPAGTAPAAGWPGHPADWR